MGLNSVKEKLAVENINGHDYWTTGNKQNVTDKKLSVYLLPGFDEYILGYTDRSAALNPENAKKIVPWSNGMFQSTIVINGKITGTWKADKKKNITLIKAKPFLKFKKNEKKLLLEAAEDYGNFLGTQIELSIED